MARLSVPLVDTAYYSEADKKGIISSFTDIQKRFKTEIKQAKSLTNLDEDIITSFIFAESNGNPNAISSSGAAGLMQVKPSSVVDIIVLENKAGRLTEAEKKVLAKQMGRELVDCICTMRYLGQPVKCLKGKKPSTLVTKAMMLNPEFNILIGAIYLGILIDQHTINGEIRMDQVVIRYNRGYFTKVDRMLSPEKMLVKAKKMGKEAVNYITKMTGTNGLLSIVSEFKA